MASLRRFAPFALSTAVLVAATGCGVQFEPQSHVTTLRVLGVQKSKPYARPGGTVVLNLLGYDGLHERGRTATVRWFGGCVNPDGDLYYGCFQQFVADPETLKMGDGNTFLLKIPDDIITSHVAPRDPGQSRFGVAFVYFTLCAGTVEFTVPTSAQDIPIRCIGDDGTTLGPDDFVIGYTTIYAYEDLTNENPRITEDFEWDGRSVGADCVGNACVGRAITAPDCSVEGSPCVPRCTSNPCPSIPFNPVVDSTSAEKDEIGAAQSSSTLLEQMWINYYVDRGKLKSEVRLLNDAIKGWNSDYGTELTIPSEPGPLTIWSVAHDNRGGTQWARLTINVQ